MNEDRILSMIALANKAGRVVSGEFMCLDKVRSGEASLIVVATDSGKNCKKKFKNKSEFFHIDYLEISSKKDLGKMIGKGEKAVIVICDEGFKDGIMKMA